MKRTKGETQEVREKERHSPTGCLGYGTHFVEVDCLKRLNAFPYKDGEALIQLCLTFRREAKVKGETSGILIYVAEKLAQAVAQRLGTHLALEMISSQGLELNYNRNIGLSLCRHFLI